MNDEKITEEETLKEQISQLREAITAMENQSCGVASIGPEELWAVMKQNMDDSQPVHPRLQQIMNGHVEVEEVRRSLKRMENDLADLRNIDSSEKLFDPLEHEIDRSEDRWNEEESDEGEDSDEADEPQLVRDKEQRPLTAYANPKEE